MNLYWSCSKFDVYQNPNLKPIFGYYLGVGCHTKSTLTKLVDVAITVEFCIRTYICHFEKNNFLLFFLDQQIWKYWYQLNSNDFANVLNIIFIKYFLNNLVMYGFFFAKLVKAKFSWKEPPWMLFILGSCWIDHLYCSVESVKYFVLQYI